MFIGGVKDHRPTAGFTVESFHIWRCTELVGEKTDRVPPQAFGGLVSESTHKLNGIQYPIPWMTLNPLFERPFYTAPVHDPGAIDKILLRQVVDGFHPGFQQQRFINIRFEPLIRQCNIGHLSI